ncbi:MAG: CDP-diacylglycerol--serine O-phosphatidyltransferase [Bacteroidales bacterium]|nr:CDP-diacylglycerol--serine O-phosphatidyltransferase [Bacteroidales bacterium]MDD3860411.1 CDP-diacylglycerol--serine O-phosphatidyltransferase [Bacteroidales bacterium]
MKIIKSLPSVISSLNLVSGAAATIFAFQGDIETAVYLILFASVCDFFDGFAARLLNAVSEFGKQIDSLADLISFGFAPSAILYNHIISNHILPKEFAFASLLIVVFSALRLAKFNIDTEQKTEFRGLPTPASAILLIAICFPNNFGFINITNLFLNDIFIISIIALLPILLVSRIKLFSLKIHGFDFKNNIWQVLLLISTIIFLIIFGISGLAFSIILYLALSILRQILTKKEQII